MLKLVPFCETFSNLQYMAWNSLPNIITYSPCCSYGDYTAAQKTSAPSMMHELKTISNVEWK